MIVFKAIKLLGFVCQLNSVSFQKPCVQDVNMETCWKMDLDTEETEISFTFLFPFSKSKASVTFTVYFILI